MTSWRSRKQQGQPFTAGPVLTLVTVHVITTRSMVADIASGALGLRAGACRPQGIPKDIPLGDEAVGGAIDRLQEHQQIRLI
jgi:hypothetical protein